MACEFPLGPTLNQIHSCTGGFNYYWDGYGWQFLPGASLGFYAITSQNNLFTGLNQFSSGISGTGATFSGNIFGNTGNFNSLQVTGNLTILGQLSVDGLIISKTGFSGYTLDADEETVESVIVDGGQF